MTKKPVIHVVQCKPSYWYAEIKVGAGVRVLGRGGFPTEQAARAWADEEIDAPQGQAREPAARA
jgi:hypothetical protein